MNPGDKWSGRTNVVRHVEKCFGSVRKGGDRQVGELMWLVLKLQVLRLEIISKYVAYKRDYLGDKS